MKEAKRMFYEIFFTNSVNNSPPRYCAALPQPSNGVNACDSYWKIKNGCLASRILQKKGKLKGDLALMKREESKGD